MSQISLIAVAGDFAEDKDIAASIRLHQIIPALNAGTEVVLDFTGVTLVTQSFIHALICDPLRVHGEDALARLVFKGCSDGVRGIVETVVQYSLETMDDDGETDIS